MEYCKSKFAYHFIILNNSEESVSSILYVCIFFAKFRMIKMK
ncbi:hypothetical protein BSFG_04856 [Bacteroides sp. 4_3_47FAA]|nr:hypothetical protein BSFG_04856 [Bacteroides sp. 4_3_47FAA]